MLSIRVAVRADIPTILDLIRSLAAYEREPLAVQATEADLLRDGFGNRPCFECLLAEEEPDNIISSDATHSDATTHRQPVGFALYFYNYSTWRGRSGIHLEDLFVLPAFRGRGIGKALLKRVAARAVEQRLPRFELHVLEWNTAALDFYRALGAELLAEWRLMRISDQALRRLAAHAESEKEAN